MRRGKDKAASWVNGAKGAPMRIYITEVLRSGTDSFASPRRQPTKTTAFPITFVDLAANARQPTSDACARTRCCPTARRLRNTDRCMACILRGFVKIQVVSV
jgi:hypothetical protein